MSKQTIEWSDSCPLIDIFYYEQDYSKKLEGPISETGWYFMLRWEGFDDAETPPRGPYESEEHAFLAGNEAWNNDEHLPDKARIH